MTEQTKGIKLKSLKGQAHTIKELEARLYYAIGSGGDCGKLGQHSSAMAQLLPCRIMALMLTELLIFLENLDG